MTTRKPKMTRTTLDVLEAFMDKADERLYGLQIAEATGLKTGTVYPILARLHQVGWVTAEWETAAADAKGPRKKFYRLTPTGRLEAQRALDARDAISARTRAKRASLGFNH